MKQMSIKVQMLGAFSISCNDIVLDANKNRSRKIWQLLAYLIYNRNRVISQEELFNVLWEDSDSQDNTSGALNTILWRTRQALSPIADVLDENLIVRTKDGCTWNPDVPTEVDVSEFESFYQKGKTWRMKISAWTSSGRHWFYTKVVFWKSCPAVHGIT